MNKQHRAPLFDGIRRYLSKGYTSFHTPGHRGGSGLVDLATTDLMAMDLTELTDSDGSDVQEWRRDAERLAADFFGADETYFLANGATEGVLALCLSVGSPGDEIIVARDCHLSVIHGIILAGLKPIFADPYWISGHALPALPKPDTVKQWIDKHPKAKAVWVTNPSYAGIVGDLQVLANLAHRAGMLFLVDEAHGGYMNLTGLTVTEARDVADAWVHGAHKMMGSMTQTGFLHLRGSRLDRLRLVAALDWVRTTSPSYPLLSSLDLMRRRLSISGEEQFQTVAGYADKLRKILHAHNIDVLMGPLSDSYQVDPMKIVLSWLRSGVTGLEAQRRLRVDERIQAEYADRDHLVFFLSPVQRGEDICRLTDAALKLKKAGAEALRPTEPPPTGNGPIGISPREAVFQPYTTVSLDEAIGRVAASSIAPYPPGIPLWVPGETIDEAKAVWLQDFQKAGGTAVGYEPEGKIRILA